MIARLEFDLPDERYEFECAVNAEKWRSVIWELDQKLRSLVKYSVNSGTVDIPTVDFIWSELRDLIESSNLSLD